jgi:glycosyltransferase involved in cell wall biosynthesis
MRLDAFERPQAPLPEQPVALFVGVLERYKSFDVLADAWRLAAPRIPQARLRLLGDGTLAREAERLLSDLPAQTTWTRRVPPDEVAHALDDAWFLVLPSRSEGMGRVIVEAFRRGRPVLGTRAGSIPDLVKDGVSGLLVEPGRVDALADALVRLLEDHALVERLAEGARAAASQWTQTPDEWARRVRELVESL